MNVRWVRPLWFALPLFVACNGGGSSDGSADGTASDDDGTAGSVSSPGSADDTAGATSLEGDATADDTADDTADTTADEGTGDSGDHPLCGNGDVDPGEDCDDGNDVDDDWCTASCVVATCGDGIVWAAAETCDDRNHDDGDGCSADCVLESCGDGVLDAGEQCDLGPNNGAHGALCSQACVSAGVALADTHSYDLEWDSGYGSIPVALRSGDINGDGHGDVITANQYSGGSTIIYGFGDGTMWTPFSMDLQQSTRAIVASDFDGDGRSDLAIALDTPPRLAIARGQDAVVAEPATVDLALAPRALAAGDVDDDGDIDLVIANHDASSVSIVLGDGDGEFVASGNLSTIAGGGGLGPWSVATGDVTGDGIVDIVTANRDSSDITVFEGVGDGAFGVAQTHALGGEAPEAVALVDLDGDGALDIVTADYESDEISVLVAEGGGDFGVANEFPTAGEGPRGLAVGDVDGDGALDVVSADADGDAISLFLGIDGGGALELALGFDVSQPDVPNLGSAYGLIGRGPARVELADLDGDDDLDIVTVNQRSKDLTVLVGDGDGDFAEPEAYEYLPRWRPTSESSEVALALADLDDDARLDLAVVDSAAHSLEVVAGAGDGRLLPSTSAEIGYQGQWWNNRDVALGDLDGDGQLDFATSRGSYTGYNYGLQLPSGQFYFVSNGAGGYLSGAAIADNDGDGLGDIFFGGNSSVIAFPAEGSSYSVPLGSVNESVLATDVTGDGLVDLLVADPYEDAVMLAAGTGTDQFGGANPISTLVETGGQAPAWVIAHELSGDAHLDLVTANRTSGDLSIMLGLGNGAFAPATRIELGVANEITRVRVGDFNGDLRPDLVATGDGADRLEIAVGFGNGNFATPQEFSIGASGRDVEAVDLDGDGIADLVTTGTDAIEVRLSDGHVVL